MKIRKFMKAFVAVLLIACSLFSFVACDDEIPEVNKDKLANQYETKRYYFRQGYTADWKVSLQGTDGNLVADYSDQGLALQLVPNAEEKGVYYNVFCNWGKDIGMTTSTTEIAGMVMDPSGKLAFNRINYVEEQRKEYQQSSEEAVKKMYNRMEWNQVEFSFINEDGEQCKGVWNLLADGKNFYIVSYEALASKFDTYRPQFEEMIEDFKKTGFEKEK